ncbi:MAG: acetyl-CoA carboxylase, carboxyltransferase subunit beta [Alphaproteobacteria bacterium]
MNWLRSITRPSIATERKKDVTADIWQKCPACGHMLYEGDVTANLNVCTACGHHLRLDVDTRLGLLLDEGFTTVAVPELSDDPLTFKDSKKYKDRLVSTRKALNQRDAFRVVQGAIGGQKLVVMAMDFAFMGGSMGRAVGQAIVTAAQAAVAGNLPLLIITASGGARMQEGTHSLMQMARTTAALQELKMRKLPYIALLTDPTTGGITASFAMQGDVQLAEPGAMIGFAGKRVIEKTVRENLPDGFQTAEYLEKNGMIDAVVPRTDQRRVLANLLSILHKTA